METAPFPPFLALAAPPSARRNRTCYLISAASPAAVHYSAGVLLLSRLRHLSAPPPPPFPPPPRPAQSCVEVNSDVLSRFNCSRLPGEIRTKLGHFAVAQISVDFPAFISPPIKHLPHRRLLGREEMVRNEPPASLLLPNTFNLWQE